MEQLNMGSALYPEFDIPIFASTPVRRGLFALLGKKNIELTPIVTFGGKALAHAAYDDGSSMNLICERLGIQKIVDFYSESAQEAFDKVGFELPNDLNADEGLKWFNPLDAIRVISHILMDDNLLMNNSQLKSDLIELKSILEIGHINKRLFRLRIDI